MSLPRMSVHIGDYKKDTGHLRAAGHGAYFLLWMHYWATGGLPDDDAQLASIACMTDREWQKHKTIIRALFKSPGEWRHKRIDRELAEAQAKYERRASAGKQGGNAKAQGKQCSSNATAKPYQPITDNPKEERGGGGAREELVSREAKAVAEEVMAIFEIDREFTPPGWCGAAMRIQSGLNEGWQPEIILLAARKIAAKRDGPPDNFTYLEKPIAREHALASKPIPVVNPEAPNVQANQRHPGGAYGASKDRFRDAHADLKASIAADDDREEGGRQIVELLPASRRG